MVRVFDHLSQVKIYGACGAYCGIKKKFAILFPCLLIWKRKKSILL